MKQCTVCGKTKSESEFSIYRLLHCDTCERKRKLVWYNRNKKKVRSQQKEYRNTHNTHSLDNLRRFHKNNPYKGSEYANRRRIRVKENGGSFSAKEFELLCALYGDMCLRCFDTNTKLTVDHVIPLVLGGSNGIGNIQPLCRTCNQIKHTETTDYRWNMVHGD